MGKLINELPGSRLLISSLPGSASRTYVESRACLVMRQAFSKPCLVNFISKDTHIVFSIYIPVNNFLDMSGRFSELNQY